MPPERRAGGGGREAGVEGEREGGMEGGSRPNIPCLTNRAVEAKRQAQQKACPQHCQNHPQYRHGAAAAMAACTVRDIKSWVLWREQAGPPCTRVDGVGEMSVTHAAVFKATESPTAAGISAAFTGRSACHAAFKVGGKICSRIRAGMRAVGAVTIYRCFIEGGGAGTATPGPSHPSGPHTLRPLHRDA